MFSAFQIFNISFISLTPYRQFKFKFSVYQLLSFTSGRTRAHMVSHLWWALVFITACDSFQISCNSDFSDSALVGDLVRHHFEFSADLSISFSELFIAQMEVDDADWILISNPCPKSRPAPKPIPKFCPRHAASLSQPLSKGGKEVPKFERPTPYPVLQSTRSSKELTVVGVHEIPNSDVTLSKPVILPAQAPRGSSAPQRPRVQGISIDLQRRWIALVHSIGNLSQVWNDFQGSFHFDSHCLRLLDKFSNSTMFKYIGTLQCVHNILLEFSLTWQAIGTYQLSDLLQITHEGRQTDWGFGASAAIKALRWLQKTLQIPAWSTLHGPVVNSFLTPKIHERKEAIPLSLFIVKQWERRLLMKDCPLQDQVVLGGFLCMLWAGLRFSDGQRINLQSLSWCITALRGSCFQTKTTKSGQPWALQARGFLSRGDWSWTAQWLVALDTIWGPMHNAQTACDFLLPMTLDTGFVQPMIPMSYSQALKWMRFMCTLPWKLSDTPLSANPNDYTLHSLKTTALSWSNQLAQQGLVTEEQRHLQGHHRRGSMRLYSRDDTAGQLALQDTLIIQVQSGYRFVTPWHRGSQQPIREPPVKLESFAKSYQEYRWTFFPFNNAVKDPLLKGQPTAPATIDSGDEITVESDSSSSSSSSSSSDSPRKVSDNTTLFGPPDELVVARFTKIQHIMLQCGDQQQPVWEGVHYRAACGARLPRDHCHFDTQLHPSYSICRHAACCNRWQQVSTDS